jgi:cytochrome o ubiquinol oxidase operon protein cyoD
MKNDFSEPNNLSLRGYVSGFVLSLLLTLGAYILVRHHLDTHHLSPSDSVAVLWLLILALTQLFVQLVFFLHLGRESKPRWNLVVFLFAVIVVFILVAGSLWIMWNLNYHMAPVPSDQQIIHDEGVHPSAP